MLIFIESFRINIQEPLLLLKKGKKKPFKKQIEKKQNVQNTILK